MAIAFSYAARSDIGLTRSSNQDSGYAGPHLLTVADGMGGAAGGDIASSVALAHLVPLDGDSHGSDDLLDHLQHAVESAHSDLGEYVAQHPELAGLGTTVIAMLRSGSTAAMVHIGDSRAYLLREGQLHQVTTDHTFVQHLVDIGQITPEQAETHPQRSIILRALGDNSAALDLDTTVRQLKVGERWLLCSDGLSGMVSPDTIAETLTEIDDVDACADRLIDLALRAGGQDNITVILADVVDAATPTANSPQIVGAAAVERNSPTRGTGTPAGRAAALLRPADETPEPKPRWRGRAEEGIDLDAPPRRAWWVKLLGALGILGLVIAGVVAGYNWTQTQYYLAPATLQASDPLASELPPGTEVVAIYQGIRQKLGPLELSHVHEHSELEVSALPNFAQSRLAEGITATDLADARVILGELEAEAG